MFELIIGMVLIGWMGLRGKKDEFWKLDFDSWFYKNCKRQRKNKAKICQECPFRDEIEDEEFWRIKNKEVAILKVCKNCRFKTPAVRRMRVLKGMIGCLFDGHIRPKTTRACIDWRPHNGRIK